MFGHQIQRVDRLRHGPNRSGRWTSTALKIIGRSVPSPTGQHLTPVIRVDGQDVRPSSYDAHTMTYSFRLPKPSSSFTLHFAHSARQHADSLKIEYAESFASRATFYVDGIIPENDEDGIVYHTVGVNGAAVPHYLKCEYFERQMAALCPDLVILSIGINDASDLTLCRIISRATMTNCFALSAA